LLSGTQIRYVKIVRELAKCFDVSVYTPGHGKNLQEVLPEASVFGYNSDGSPKHTFSKPEYLRSILNPNSSKLFLPEFSYYPGYENFIHQETNQYDVSLYIEMFALCSYSKKDLSKIIICDFIDSRSRYLHNSIKHFELNYVKGWFDLIYLRKIKRKFIDKKVTGIVVTPKDKQVIQKLLPYNTFYTIPNGVNQHCISESDIRIKKSTKTVLFYGKLDYKPNVNSLEFCLKHIWQKIVDAVPEARFIIVGKNAPETLLQNIKEKKRVILLENVENVFHEYRKATVSLSPVFLGSGIKNKILESLASATPVVTNLEGATGIALVDGVHGVITENKEQLASAVLKILNSDFQEYSKICNNCYALSKNYDWVKIGKDFSEVISSQLKRNTGAQKELLIK
jgi:glycosyltransferase involved in cell wall biosynthesis